MREEGQRIERVSMMLKCASALGSRGIPRFIALAIMALASRGYCLAPLDSSPAAMENTPVIVQTKSTLFDLIKHLNSSVRTNKACGRFDSAREAFSFFFGIDPGPIVPIEHEISFGLTSDGQSNIKIEAALRCDRDVSCKVTYININYIGKETVREALVIDAMFPARQFKPRGLPSSLDLAHGGDRYNQSYLKLVSNKDGASRSRRCLSNAIIQSDSRNGFSSLTLASEI
jgi:hypothetical protein